MKIRNLAKVVGVIFLLAIAVEAIGTAVGSGSWRYRMTVLVNTPEGIKTGSAVREVKITQQPRITPEVTSHTRVKGEAVIVDLGNRGVLFALMSDNDYRFVTSSSNNPDAKTLSNSDQRRPDVTTPEGVKHFQNLKHFKETLNPRRFPSYPLLVAFKDINDQKSVKLVMQWSEGKTPPFPKQYFLKEDNFEKIFGQGVSLREIVVERTEDPVTWGIKEKLPWLSKMKGGYLDPSVSGGRRELGNILHEGHFIQGSE